MTAKNKATSLYNNSESSDDEIIGYNPIDRMDKIIEKLIKYQNAPSGNTHNRNISTATEEKQNENQNELFFQNNLECDITDELPNENDKKLTLYNNFLNMAIITNLLLLLYVILF